MTTGEKDRCEGEKCMQCGGPIEATTDMQEWMYIKSGLCVKCQNEVFREQYEMKITEVLEKINNQLGLITEELIHFNNNTQRLN